MTTVATQHSNFDSIRREFLLTGNAAAAVAARSVSVDQQVITAYETHLRPVIPTGLALLAVGGYGRRELFPYSDIDLIVLVARSIEGDGPRAALSAFLRELWDSGLRLSQSVRTVAECCELDTKNIELSISLIDQRFLGGDAALYEQLCEKLPRFFRAQRSSLIGHLCEMTRARHAKFHDAIYHLEPNVKEMPGGIRDLHAIHWLAHLRNSDDDPLAGLTAAKDFLWNLRCRLHYRSGRDNNGLTFEIQETLSQDPASWMREYYRHAREVNRAALRQLELAESLTEGGLLQSFRDWRSRLSNADFTVNKERLYFKMPQQLTGDPMLALRLFEFVARHGIKLSLDAERRLVEHGPLFREYFASTRNVWPVLNSIFTLPNATMAIRSMHESGVLLALFPEWNLIDSLVIRDFYHRYTVDEHTLVTLEALEQLRDIKDSPKRRFTDLLQELENPALPRAALLFHDVGKGGEGEGHSRKSKELAKVAFQRIQMPPDELKSVLFLIEHHLALSSVMTGRDLGDPLTAKETAERVGTIENLKYLTAVTYADISAVNPEAMTPWRLEQLWRVYLIAYAELMRGLDTDRIHAVSDPSTASFLEGLPTRYLRTHSEEEILAHQELEAKSKYSGLAIDLKRVGGFYRLTVVTSDRPSLFASIAGVLAAFGMNIVKAEAFSNHRGTVVDSFSFSDPMRTLELNPMEIERLKLVLQRAVLGKEDVKKLLAGRPKPKMQSSQVRPAVSFDSNASTTATLVEVTAQDRPGLLYDMAATLSGAGCSIDVVLIDTEAHKALDVFYCTVGGKKLPVDLQAKLKQQLLAVL
jgi:[protein-PII] uridylyltransferase